MAINNYNDGFYRDRRVRTQASIDRVLDLLLKVVPQPHSAVDIGCGVGAWLEALKARGVRDALGIDGPWVKQEYLAISPEEFRQQDLAAEIKTERRFDLAISLEVAEHLPPGKAAAFVGSLAALSDFVLFSAATPFQGGTHHVNEQPIEYWLDLFARHGYVGIDCLRPYLWNDSRVLPWYRQNAVLLAASSRIGDLSLPRESPQPNGYLHPEIYLPQLIQAHTVKGSWKLLRRAIKDKLRGMFGAA